MKVEYWVDLKKRKRFPSSLFTSTYLVKRGGVEEFRRTNGRLPEHVHIIKSTVASRSVVDLIERVLADKSSSDVRELIDTLSADNELAIGQFCDQYELGNWFYEAILLNDASIADSLRLLCNQKEREETRAYDDQQEIARDLALAQGGRL